MGQVISLFEIYLKKQIIIAFKIAKKISYERKDSHKIDREKEEKIHTELENFATQRISEGCDYIIMGHYHHSYHECDEKNYNYVIFDGNTLEIKNFF